MIIDSLKSFGKYENLHASFGKVHEFIKKNDLHTLTDGRHTIEEGNIWCSVSTSTADEIHEAPLEVHDSFIDIIIALEGTVIVGFRDRSKCLGIDVKYDEASDTALMKEAPEAYINYSDDNFVICFPQDCHSEISGTGSVRKAVIKVRL